MSLNNETTCIDILSLIERYNFLKRELLDTGLATQLKIPGNFRSFNDIRNEIGNILYNIRINTYLSLGNTVIKSTNISFPISPARLGEFIFQNIISFDHKSFYLHLPEYDALYRDINSDNDLGRDFIENLIIKANFQKVIIKQNVYFLLPENIHTLYITLEKFSKPSSLLKKDSA